MRLQGREKGKIRTVGQIQENLPPEAPPYSKVPREGRDPKGGPVPASGQVSRALSTSPRPPGGVAGGSSYLL